MTRARRPDNGWPFWAPLGDEEIADALELAGLRPRERFVDLGCGDGRVMAAALDFGASVAGYEVDRGLVACAKERLASAGDRAQVFERSFFNVQLDADVVFAYLSPTVLQRLTPQLKVMPASTRIVTAWFDVPGLDLPASRRGNVRCYRASSFSAPPTVALAAGWSSPGLLCALPLADEMLVTTSLIHPRGPVIIEVDEALSDLVAIAAGCDAVTGDITTIAIDLVLAARSAGTVTAGTLRAAAAGTCELFCFASATTSPGFWPIDAYRCERLRSQFANEAGVR